MPVLDKSFPAIYVMSAIFFRQFIWIKNVTVFGVRKEFLLQWEHDKLKFGHYFLPVSE
jgi:hypothetical protein